MCCCFKTNPFQFPTNRLNVLPFVQPLCLVWSRNQNDSPYSALPVSNSICRRSGKIAREVELPRTNHHHHLQTNVRTERTEEAASGFVFTHNPLSHVPPNRKKKKSKNMGI